RSNLNSYADAREQRRTERPHRRSPDVVALARQVLKRAEHFNTAAKRARSERIQREVLIKRQEILIVIKLHAGGAALNRKRETMRVRVPHLKCQKVTSDLRDQQSLKRCIRRELQYRRIDKLITARDREGARYAGFGLQFQTARAGAPEVLPLPSDQRRRHAQCDVCDRPSDLAPEECTANVHPLIGR